MHPFTAVLGFIAGSLVSMAFSLGVVALVFWTLRGEDGRFAAELPEVLRAFGMFSVLAVCASLGFMGSLRQRRWRFVPLALLWTGLAVVGWHYWPS